MAKVSNRIAFLAMFTILAMPGMATAASRYDFEATCSGKGKEVLVVDWQGHGLAMYVYEYGDLIASGYATKSVSSSSGVRIVSYAMGSVLRGGANLRIRVRDSNFPQNKGMGHLTMRGSNDLVDCDMY